MTSSYEVTTTKSVGSSILTVTEPHQTTYTVVQSTESGGKTVTYTVSEASSVCSTCSTTVSVYTVTSTNVEVLGSSTVTSVQTLEKWSTIVYTPTGVISGTSVITVPTSTSGGLEQVNSGSTNNRNIVLHVLTNVMTILFAFSFF